MGPRSSHHSFQFLQTGPDLVLDLLQFSDDLRWRGMLHVLINELAVPIDRKVIPLGHDVRLRDAEALIGPEPLTLGAITLRPAREYVGEVVLRVVFGGERFWR